MEINQLKKELGLSQQDLADLMINNLIELGWEFKNKCLHKHP